MVRNRKGFTLIELMIVVAIIGVLAAIAIPAYSNYTRKAKISEVTNAMGALATALVEYYQGIGEMPAETITTNYADGAAAMPDSVADILGISIPGTHLGDGNVMVEQVAADTARITVTFGSGSDLGAEFGGQNLTLTVKQGAQGTWGGSVPQGYIPKS